MNKIVTKYIFPYSSFHAEHDGQIHFHLQQCLRKLEGLLQPHVSLFIPPPYPVLSQYIPLRSKTECNNVVDAHITYITLVNGFLLVVVTLPVSSANFHVSGLKGL